MPKRAVNSSFWKDSYVIDLDPSEKLLFLYLLTNPQANIAGVYEISIREMAFDTGYDKDMIVKILARFERDEKIIYKKGWIGMRNWMKHQKFNPNMEIGAQKLLDAAPKWLVEELTTGGQGSLFDEDK